jgi:hypothetical protein
MTKQDIKDLIYELHDKYYVAISENKLTIAIDIHDEISRWMRELKEWKI